MKAVEKIDAAVKVRDVSILRQDSAEAPKGSYPLQIHLVFETFLKHGHQKNNA